MVGHRSRRDQEEAGFGGALPNQRHRRGGAGTRVTGFDAHKVGHLLRVTVPAEVEFGWHAGGFEVGVSCHTGSRSRPAGPLSPGQWTCNAHGDSSTVTVVCTTPSLATDRRPTNCSQPPRDSFEVMNRTIDIAQAALARHTLAAYPPDLS